MAGLLGPISIAQSQSSTLVNPSANLILPRRETILYPGATSSLTIPDQQSSASVTLNLSRKDDGIQLNVKSASLGDRCALVSVQLPRDVLTGNEQYQLATTPISFVPLATKPGTCGAISTYGQNVLSQPQTEYQTFMRVPFALDGKVKLPFTVEVFFLSLSN
ncbi:hypothetical protein BST81_22765 [Leptolyngbya sp. 'hensonii']|nr:hypothetical protein BST81_22765 [Leptolyngbya sp. 'hensonii']